MSAATALTDESMQIPLSGLIFIVDASPSLIIPICRPRRFQLLAARAAAVNGNETKPKRLRAKLSSFQTVD